ncbi:unnamed protein product, partial [marine sediment metagenome]
MSFKEKLKTKKFIKTIEFDLPPKMKLEDGFDTIEEMIADDNIDAINITDSPGGHYRINSIALAVLLRERTDIPIISHLTCRDRNVIGLRGNILA